MHYRFISKKRTYSILLQWKDIELMHDVLYSQTIATVPGIASHCSQLY